MLSYVSDSRSVQQLVKSAWLHVILKRHCQQLGSFSTNVAQDQGSCQHAFYQSIRLEMPCSLKLCKPWSIISAF